MFCKFTITCQFYLSKKNEAIYSDISTLKGKQKHEVSHVKKDKKKKSTLQPAFTLATSTVDIIGLNFNTTVSEALCTLQIDCDCVRSSQCLTARCFVFTTSAACLFLLFVFCFFYMYLIKVQWSS